MRNADELFEVILRQDGSDDYMEYARMHARIGLGTEGETLRVQISHVLKNLKPWRGKTAKEVKKALRALEKQLR